jgi:hypothetical protein
MWLQMVWRAASEDCERDGFRRVVGNVYMVIVSYGLAPCRV